MPSPLVIQVAAGLVFRGGRVLITQRLPGRHLGGLWEFPGGKLEAGESWADALVRELQEELGVTVSVGRQLAEIEHVYPERSVRLQFFICRLVAGEPVALGCANYRWVAEIELDHFEFPPADQQLLKLLRGTPEFAER